MLINGPLDGNTGCYFGWHRSTRVLALNGQTGFAGIGGTVGIGQPTLENNNCKLDLAESLIDDSGSNLIIKVALTFKSAMIGTFNNWVYVVDRAGQVAGYTSMGTWSTAAATINNIGPTAGPLGTLVTIYGANFGTQQGSSAITFNGLQAAAVSWSPSAVVVAVPFGATTGNMIFTVGGVAAAVQAFAVTPSISIPTNSITRMAGTATATYTVNVSPINGFTGTVNFAAIGLPGGGSVSFSPASVTGSGSAIMTVNTATLHTGTYAFSVTATWENCLSDSSHCLN